MEVCGAGKESSETGVIRVLQIFNVIDNAQSNSLTVVHKCSDSGHLLVLPTLHPFPLLGNDNPGFCLGEAITKAPDRTQSGPERYTLTREWDSKLLERLVLLHLEKTSIESCCLDP